jgi:hypothetical protein
MFDELKHRHRQVRECYPENLNLRIHRALSWLKAAESSEDPDGKFLFCGSHSMPLTPSKSMIATAQPSRKRSMSLSVSFAASTKQVN